MIVDKCLFNNVQKDEALSEEKINRTKLLQVGHTPGELEKINAGSSKSTYWKLSEYVCRKLLDKPLLSIKEINLLMTL
jgi:hypothetical protein